MKLTITLGETSIVGSAESALVVAPKVLAAVFAELDDEEQADFFEEVGHIFDRMTRPPGYLGVWIGGEGQAMAIGRHMARCECVTEAGREFLATVYKAMVEERGGDR